MITIKQFFANLIMEINETFEKIYQVAEENKIFESVYNKFGKLDSLEEKLSPKLKALLAAGLIGTASLGMQSCAQPTDDYTNPAPTEEVKPKDNETPAPADNTTNPTRETPKEDDGGKTTVKTEEQNWADTFGQLLTYSEINKEHAKRLANVNPELFDPMLGGTQYVEGATNYKYTGNGFIELNPGYSESEPGVDYNRYLSGEDCVYHIPVDKADSLINASKTIANQI